MEDYYKEASEIGYMIYNGLYTRAGYIAQRMKNMEIDEENFEPIEHMIAPIVRLAVKHATVENPDSILKVFGQKTKLTMPKENLDTILEMFIANAKIFAEMILKEKSMLKNEPDFLYNVTRKATLDCFRRLARVIE